MLFSYNKTLLSLIYQFSIGIFFLYLILCSHSPACAGKTLPEQANYLHQRDHPRMCGKSLRATTKPSVGSGSPPRVREKPTNLLKLILKLRITPAYAGTTSCVLSSGLRDRDHPRMCRKNHKANTSICVCLGSPPRVREKLKRRHHCHALSGITPASAGKTQSH